MPMMFSLGSKMSNIYTTGIFAKYFLCSKICTEFLFHTATLKSLPKKYELFLDRRIFYEKRCQRISRAFRTNQYAKIIVNICRFLHKIGHAALPISTITLQSLSLTNSKTSTSSSINIVYECRNYTRSKLCCHKSSTAQHLSEKLAPHFCTFL